MARNARAASPIPTIRSQRSFDVAFLTERCEI